MPNSILDLYKTWTKVDGKGNRTAIQSPGAFQAGTENTAAGQAVDFLSTKNSAIGTDAIKGFKPSAQKGQTEYPVKDEKIMEVARIMETGGTHSVPRLSNGNKYSDITPRQ